MAGDWLRLYRKSLDSRVFSDDWLWRLWCWCLMKANWKATWKDGREIQPGQFTLGRVEAADQLKVSPSKLYRGLDTLCSYGQIRKEANNRWTTITICNWRTYQPKEASSEQPVNSQWTASEHLADTPLIREEEGKEGKNTPPTPPKGVQGGRAVDSLDPLFDSFWRAYPNKVARVAAARIWDSLRVDGSLLAEILAAIERQKKSDVWIRGKIPRPDNWLADGRWSDVVSTSPASNGETFRDKLKRAQEEKACRQSGTTGASDTQPSSP